MNRQPQNKLYVAVLVLLITGVVLANGSSNLPSWVKENITGNDELLCHRSIGDDQFFVARTDGKIKTGYLIDVTNNAGSPKTYVVSWRFVDGDGASLETNTPPEDIKQDYVKSDGRTFSENVSYRNLNTNAGATILVSVELKKYADKTDAPSSPEQFAAEEGLEKISICEISQHDK